MGSVPGRPFLLDVTNPRPCSVCGAARELVSHMRNGVKRPRLVCRRCHSKTSYNSRKKRAAEYNAQIAEKRRTSYEYRAYDMWKGAKDRARAKGIEFSISLEFVRAALDKRQCAVTGLPFDLRLKGKRMGALSPSLDRKDPSVGYTPANSQVVCWIYKRAKGDGAHSDVMMLVEALNAICLSQAA